MFFLAFRLKLLSQDTSKPGISSPVLAWLVNHTLYSYFSSRNYLLTLRQALKADIITPSKSPVTPYS